MGIKRLDLQVGEGECEILETKHSFIYKGMRPLPSTSFKIFERKPAMKSLKGQYLLVVSLDDYRKSEIRLEWH